MKYYVCDICGKEIPRKYVCSFKIKAKYATPVPGVDAKRDICYDCACDIRNALIRLIKEKKEVNNNGQ